MKGKLSKKDQSKLRMRKMRNKNSVTSNSVTGENVTQEMTPASHVQGITGGGQSLPARSRRLTLSDGQALDRSIIVEGHASGDFIRRMRYCNESAYNFHPNEPDKSKVKAMAKAMSEGA